MSETPTTCLSAEQMRARHADIATDKIRVCHFSDTQHALEQLFRDGRWYQRGPFFTTPDAAEDYGIALCADAATIVPSIWRDYDGNEIASPQQ